MDKQKIKHILNDLSGKKVLEGMPELAYIFNRQGQMLMWNENVEKVLAYSKSELFGKELADFIAPEFQEKTLATVEAIFRERKDQTVEYELITKTGKRIPYIGSGSLTIVDGEEFFVGMAISTDKLKETEKLLKEQIIETERLKNQLYAENIYLREEYIEHHDFDEIIGTSKLLQQSLSFIKQVAPTDTIVLLKGETGTDKERFAMAIHKKSNRKDQAFIKVNCNSSLADNELFGYEKGAFVGALQKKIGRIEMANKGTLYLEEIGELSKHTQIKLLQFIESGNFERIGSTKQQKADVRIIASNQDNIEDRMSKGLFLKELFYRINVYPISIAPLRKRTEDIPLIARHFVQIFNKKLGKNIERISLKNLNELQAYSWPGNVLELQNIIERALSVSHGSLLKIEPFLNNNLKDNTKKFLPLSKYETNYLIEVLESTNWRISGPKGAAHILDIHPETLRSRLRKLKISRS